MGNVATCHDDVLEQRATIKIDSPKGMGMFKTASGSRKPSTESKTDTTSEVVSATTTFPEKNAPSET